MLYLPLLHNLIKFLYVAVDLQCWSCKAVYNRIEFSVKITLQDNIINWLLIHLYSIPIFSTLILFVKVCWLHFLPQKLIGRGLSNKVHFSMHVSLYYIHTLSNCLFLLVKLTTIHSLNCNKSILRSTHCT